MTVDDVVGIANQCLYTIIKTAAPTLLISLAVGLIISIFQTVTSIQEQTLTFIPKIVGVFAALMFFGPWMLKVLINYITDLWANFSIYLG